MRGRDEIIYGRDWMTFIMNLGRWDDILLVLLVICTLGGSFIMYLERWDDIISITYLGEGLGGLKRSNINETCIF